MSTAIIVTPGEVDIAITQSGALLEARNEALELAAFVDTVENHEEQAAAVQVCARLKGIAKLVEESRQIVKKPFREAGEKIDAAAKQFTLEVNAESKRIEEMISAYQRAGLQKARAAQAEAERQKRQAEEESRRLREELERAQAAGDQKKADETSDALFSAEMHAETIDIPATPEPQGITGASVQGSKFEFTVFDLPALYAWNQKEYPHLQFVELTERRQALSQFINAMAGVVTIPGVKIFETTKVAVRAQKPTAKLK